jgi:hypothetical protein
MYKVVKSFRKALKTISLTQKVLIKMFNLQKNYLSRDTVPLYICPEASRIKG